MAKHLEILLISKDRDFQRKFTAFCTINNVSPVFVSPIDIIGRYGLFETMKFDYLVLHRPNNELIYELSTRLNGNVKQIIFSGIKELQKDSLSAFDVPITEIPDLSFQFNALLKILKKETDKSNLALRPTNTLSKYYPKKPIDVEELLHIASHDLREPLRVIINYSQILKKRIDSFDPLEADTFLSYILDNARQMESSLNNLKVYLNIQGEKEFERIPFKSLVKDVLTDLQSEIQVQQATIHLAPMPELVANRLDISTLFFHLISNAIKFHKKDNNPVVHISAKENDLDWQFYIKDNGIGIKPEYYDMAFEIFQRVNKADEFGGSGIGLSICKRIIDKHNGKIWIDSLPGLGSCLNFTISKKIEEA